MWDCDKPSPDNFDLLDRLGNKRGFDDIDVDVDIRREIVEALAAIVRAAAEGAVLPQPENWND